MPRKRTGARAAATAESVEPPLAAPSILVMMTPPTSTLAANARAWSPALWPVAPSITKSVASGCTRSATSRISAKSASLCAWRPDVSTMMTSRDACSMTRTPAAATSAGSVAS